jgi:hypothetical protein
MIDISTNITNNFRNDNLKNSTNVYLYWRKVYNPFKVYGV